MWLGVNRQSAQIVEIETGILTDENQSGAVAYCNHKQVPGVDKENYET